MSAKQDREDFNKRWNIQEDNLEENFRKFRNRIFSIFSNLFQNGLAMNALPEIDFALGLENSESMRDVLEQQGGSFKEFCRVIEVVINLPYRYWFFNPELPQDMRDYCRNKLREAVDLSNVNLSMGEQGKRVILYPAGEKLLDVELVNKPLSFLSGNSSQHFAEALRFYQDKKYVDSAEQLRKCCEEFLRAKLSNSQGLDKNIGNLQNALKIANGDKTIRNKVFQILSYLDEYFNKNSKHGSTVDEIENEFLIYQVGLLIRYFHRILP